MNTPAHILLSAAIYARPNAPAICAAALAGAAVPDLSVFVMVGWEHLVEGRPLALVFGQDYRHPVWQTVFSIDNSIPLWALLLAFGALLRRPVLLAFAGAGLLHVLADLPLHNEDARMHFQPFTDWAFRSPLSYWDVKRYAWAVAPAELALALGCIALLWRRFRGRAARAALVLAALLEAALTVLPLAAWAMAP